MEFIKSEIEELSEIYNVAKKQKRSSTPSTSFASENDLKEAGWEDLSEIFDNEMKDDNTSTYSINALEKDEEEEKEEEAEQEEDEDEESGGMYVRFKRPK